MAALQHCAAFSDQSPHSLLVAQRRIFDDPVFGPLSCPSECRKNRDVPSEIDRIVAPITCCDHPPVKVKDPHQFVTVETDLRRQSAV